jgi:hypothetical protein
VRARTYKDARPLRCSWCRNHVVFEFPQGAPYRWLQPGRITLQSRLDGLRAPVVSLSGVAGRTAGLPACCVAYQGVNVAILVRRL